VPSLVSALIAKTRTRRQVGRALSSGDLGVQFAGDLAELKAVDGNVRGQLLLVEIDAPNVAAIGSLIEDVAALAAGRPVLLLSIGGNDPLLELIHRNDITNVVSQHGAVRATTPEFDERELLVTCAKTLSGDIFGIEKYVGAWGAKLHRLTVKSMAEKHPALEGIEGLLSSMQVSQTIATDIINVADELLLNAIVHAPRDAEGREKYANVGPASDLVLARNEYVSLTYGCDGQRFMLGVTDEFGELQRETLYRYVSKGFSGDKLTPEDKVSGAGLGLTLAFRGIHQLICNVHVSRRTEIIAGWYLPVTSTLEFRRVGKSFNLFWLPRPTNGETK
jgi:hypothetical protein